jgi:hypothetical protein
VPCSSFVRSLVSHLSGCAQLAQSPALKAPSGCGGYWTTPRGLSVASWASNTALARRVCASAGAGSTHHDQSSSSGRVKRTGSSSPSGRVRRSRSRKAKFPRGLCERPREEGRGNRSVDRPLSTTRRSTNIAIATGVSRRSSSDAESSQPRSAISRDADAEPSSSSRLMNEIRVIYPGQWARWGSNPRPSDYESPALTAELRARAGALKIAHAGGSGGETRTLNQRINSPLLCRLSYPGRDRGRIAAAGWVSRWNRARFRRQRPLRRR